MLLEVHRHVHLASPPDDLFARESLLGGSGPEVELGWVREVLRDVDDEVVDWAGDKDVLDLLALQSTSAR